MGNIGKNGWFSMAFPALSSSMRFPHSFPRTVTFRTRSVPEVSHAPSHKRTSNWQREYFKAVQVRSDHIDTHFLKKIQYITIHHYTKNILETVCASSILSTKMLAVVHDSPFQIDQQTSSRRFTSSLVCPFKL